jgi:hypothetical protein
MHRSRRMSRNLYCAAVTAALGLGAQQALAAPRTPPAMAVCTQAGCQASCESRYPGQDVAGICKHTGVCVCYVGR